MAQNENLVIDITVNGKKAQVELDKVSQKTDNVGDATKKTESIMTSSWVKIGASIATATYALKKATDAYAVQLKAEKQLETALKANYSAGQDTIETWKEYASALQNVTTYGDEATLSQVAYLKTLGTSDDMIKRIIEASMDLSSATGMELNSAVMNLSKTLSGMQGELGEKIPALKALTAEELRAGKGIDVVAESVRGQARAWAETGVGGLEQASNSFGDVVEQSGNLFMMFANKSGVIGSVNTLFGTMYTKLTDLINSFKEVNELGQTELLSRRAKLTEEVTAQEEKIKKIQEEGGAWAKAFSLPQANIDLQLAQDKLKAVNSELETRKKLTEAKEKEDKPKLSPTGKTAMQELEEELEIMDIIANAKEVAFDKELERDARIIEAKARLDEQSKKNTESLQEQALIADSVGDSLQEAFGDALSGKLQNATDYMKRFTQALAEAYIRQKIIGSVTGGTGLLGQLFGQTKHTGGFITAHTGLNPDERMAKLQVGEAVIKRSAVPQNAEAIKAMNRGETVGSGAVQQTTAEINFNVQAIDSASFNQYLDANKGQIENIISNSIAKNGSVRRTIKAYA